ncbi:unnamed protein product [marine sediment metagenome]|uniref:Uncharacterized protein n=1 Tax=marine sediment metagenome TaxID=412755 RepID=X1FIJ9_9ZZZZ
MPAIAVNKPNGLNGWPVGAKEIVSFSIDNLNNINLKIIAAGDIAIIAYSR